MNTKLIMTLSAVIFGLTGLGLIFLPDEISVYLNLIHTEPFVLIVQTLGALYFAFALLNWMTKGSIIGGVYNRPIAIANFTHFVIAGLVIIKGIMNNPHLPYPIWVFASIDSIFVVLFGIILFRHPAIGPKV